jgi:hypothetical protein
MRKPIVRRELDKIIEDFIPLTKDYNTAGDAHEVLKQIVNIKCLLCS